MLADVRLEESCCMEWMCRDVIFLLVSWWEDCESSSRQLFMEVGLVS